MLGANDAMIDLMPGVIGLTNASTTEPTGRRHGAESDGQSDWIAGGIESTIAWIEEATGSKVVWIGAAIASIAILIDSVLAKIAITVGATGRSPLHFNC
jgi:hypothetical protein